MTTLPGLLSSFVFRVVLAAARALGVFALLCFVVFALYVFTGGGS